MPGAGQGDAEQSELTIQLDAVQCSCRCRHCEVTQGKPQGHLTLDGICGWRDRICRMAEKEGVGVAVALTNTELLDHPQWRQIDAELRTEGWGPCLATNGRRMAREPELIEELREKGVERVQLTLFGADANTHDAFARRAGAFKDRMRAGQLAHEAGLVVTWVYIAYRPLAEVARMSRLVRGRYGHEVDESVFLIKPQGEGWHVDHLRPAETELTCVPERLRDRFATWFGAGCETERELILALRQGTRSIGCTERGHSAHARILTLYRNGDAYPFCHERRPAYLLGNVEQEGLGGVLDRLWGPDPPRAVAARRRGLAELAAEYGAANSDLLHSGCSLCRTLVARSLGLVTPPTRGSREPCRTEG